MHKLPQKLKNEDRQSFVATRMSVPLFMLSRNRIREDELPQLKSQFKLAGKHYNQDCKKENRGEGASKATFDHYRHVTGYDKQPKNPYPERRSLRIDRTMTTWKGWQLPPNHYGVPPVPYLRKKGSKGTTFAKQHTNHARVSTKPPPFKFYDLPSEIERLFKRDNLQKGIFLSNARDRPATTRFMVSSETGCWRNPADPGPADTHSNIHEVQKNMVPVTKTARPNPHLFLRQSCVPTKPSFMMRRHITFEPGPGRYGTSYAISCPCPSGKISKPGLQLLIDEQKRLKFRRLPYKRIKKERYCDPDWGHVQGGGHQHIFLMSEKDKPKPKKKDAIAKKEAKKPEKNLTLFADAKYVNMVTNPLHIPISVRNFPVPEYVPKIVYNCVAKRAVRKQLKNNKKIAFNSGQERWKDAERPLQLTARQLEAIKESLPEDRRLIDRPVVLPSTEITGKLFHVPDHQKVTFMPKLRKRLFKFLPIPGAKVLVTDGDIRPNIVFDPDHPSGLYRKRLDETKFFKDSVLKLLAEKRSTADLATATSMVSMASHVTHVGEDEENEATEAVQAVQATEATEVTDQRPGTVVVFTEKENRSSALSASKARSGSASKEPARAGSGSKEAARSGSASKGAAADAPSDG
ncbi:uncharacterized protein LOC6593112 [Drosophila persimilis]|uniref:uncharacterized protein LOC6593112 n=1 Tax=Drosophila persimilis TaxID=7234 RepID=UPI000F09642C|nr:uncharacterized protein LOC6593112 [Drosophila persimilis]